MDIKFTCQGCGQSIIVDSSGAGSAAQCPHCSASVRVPELVGQPAVQPARPQSIGWGVFNGLCGFFIVLPLAIILLLACAALLLLLGGGFARTLLGP